eukprot:CAMPEP_0170527158 /NCGR_PEP_ID=MMETSP0209-20121228/12608_1 /TAXON_ID=665100 ORGANISM="Litonotus pictus, Strain P1" /NCGR_SAMPLE_ID=MMETSP0209 /ASSEMBLY_ACC=CAM_ASM_000301 /LENGTH=409 /DNA_ID=CAMNT_0010817479 /DNA_START=425 /DNA_END=1650 /DNA_ORIENTATION=+
MSLLLSNKVEHDPYWDFIYQAVKKNNFMSEVKENPNYNYNQEVFLDILKAFSLVKYNNHSLWEELEEIAKLVYKKLDIKDVEALVLCFGNKQQGSEDLMTDLIEFTKEESDEDDVLINYSLCLTNNFRDYDIYHKFIKYSFEQVSETISDIEEPSIDTLNNINLVYSLLPGYYKLLYGDKSYKLTSRYSRSMLKYFVQSLEKIVSASLNPAIQKKSYEEDFNSVAEIVSLPHQYGFKFRYLKKTIILGLFNQMKKKILRGEFNYQALLSYMKYFKNRGIKRAKLAEISNKEDVWEVVIENIHKMSIENVVDLVEVMKYFGVNYMRLWVFVQIVLKEKLSISYSIDITEENIKEEENNSDQENEEDPDFFNRMVNKKLNDSVEVLENKLKWLSEVEFTLKDKDFYLKDEV